MKKFLFKCRQNLYILAIGLCVMAVTGLGCTPEDPVAPAILEPIPQKVIVETVQIDSPYPKDNGTILENQICSWDCDKIQFLRYRPDPGEGNPPKAVNAIIILIPGYMGGANSFNYLGQQLVSMAEADTETGSLEVWAIDRRGNCLEDLTGMNAAENTEDPGIAVDYYYNSLEIGGKTFQGFLNDDDVPYLSEFGLKLLMDDIWTIIETLIPDQSTRNQTVFIGGHSMGGSLTSYFAGWDFDGDGTTLEDAGYNNCAGLIGLDGLVGPRTVSTTPETDIMKEADYKQGLTNLRKGEDPRLNLFMGVTPEALALFEFVGLNAQLSPDAEATLFKDIPYSKDVETLIQLLHSKNMAHFLTGSPSLKDYKYTNEALLGIFFDDNFNPSPILQTSMGFLYGGPVVQKGFPGNLAELFGLGGMLSTQGMFIPEPLVSLGGNGPLYKWANFDEVGNISDPDYKDTTGYLTYTTWENEVTDIQDVAVSLYIGPSNFPEWYFTSRISLDTSAVTASYNSKHGLNFLHNDHINETEIPMININARDNEGYNHQDVLFAAVDRPSHRESAVAGPMLKFVFDNSIGVVTVTIPAP